jgi:H+/Cl- antiporter ClcA
MVGAAAVLAGQSHLTYSLAVIMLETTQSINLFLPVIVSILVASVVGKLIQPDSVYKKAI